MVNLLSPAQRAKLLQILDDFPEREIVRYYSLSRSAIWMSLPSIDARTIALASRYNWPICATQDGHERVQDRSHAQQQRRAQGLNLVVAAIILWNTLELARAVDEL